MRRESNPPLAERRAFLAHALTCSAAGFVPTLLAGCGGGDSAPAAPVSNVANLGPLQATDANGLKLPAGFTSRVVALAGQGLAGSTYVWHQSPDGGATFATSDGGWLYVSNSERSAGAGGVGVLRFDASGTTVSQYGILSGTTSNCSGGRTPWNTWLSCEEIPTGQVWECDPFNASLNGVARPALGIFRHEAVAVDPVHRHLFMTEDTADGRFYRFVPSAIDWPAGGARAALTAGQLQVLVPDAPLPAVGDTTTVVTVRWKNVIDASVPQSTVRDAEAGVFGNAEGLYFHNGLVIFATSLDDRVWRYDTNAGTLQVIYDKSVGGGALNDVDNLTITSAGDVLVLEAPGNQEIRLLGSGGTTTAIVQVDLPGGSLSGLAMSPDGRRMYFSVQNGAGANGNAGATYEVSGPFFVAP